jgi:hypothetical protein
LVGVSGAVRINRLGPNQLVEKGSCEALLDDVDQGKSSDGRVTIVSKGIKKRWISKSLKEKSKAKTLNPRSQVPAATGFEPGAPTIARRLPPDSAVFLSIGARGNRTRAGTIPDLSDWFCGPRV